MRPMKANYLKIVAIRALYRDSMPLTISGGSRGSSFSLSSAQNVSCSGPPAVWNRPYFYTNYLWNTDGMLINMEVI